MQVKISFSFIDSFHKDTIDNTNYYVVRIKFKINLCVHFKYEFKKFEERVILHKKTHSSEWACLVICNLNSTIIEESISC